jgi:cell wall assembly regulator SMI1
MTPARWRNLLATWSREILAVEKYRQELSPDVVSSGWLGFPAATEAEIAAAEARLGIALPPSYRTFLGVTNGWRTTKTFIERLRPVGEIAWYRDAYPDLLAAWRDGEQAEMARYRETDATTTVGYWLQQTLAVSDDTEAVLLLLPRAIEPGGEWPAWFFAAWIPGEDEYPSFWDLMVAQHESFLDLEQHRPQWEEERRRHGQRP